MVDLVLDGGGAAAVTLPVTSPSIIVGPRGPEGPPGGPEQVVFTQGTPTATWLITHALATPTPDVRLIVANELVYADVEFPTATQVAVTFPSPTAGTAVLTT